MQVHKKIYHPFTLSEVATRRCVPPKLRKKTEKQVDTEFRKGDLTQQRWEGNVTPVYHLAQNNFYKAAIMKTKHEEGNCVRIEV